MPAMLSRLYHALLGAGVDDATATAAAEEAAQSDARFTAIEVQLAHIEGELDRRFAQVEMRFAQVDTRFATLEGQIARTLDAVKALSERMDSHFRITYWILGILTAALVGLAWRLLK
jgi:uncharacterized protein YhfF